MVRLTLVLAAFLPTMAWAQTPADIARQVWPLHAPAAVEGSAPPRFVSRGRGTAADLAQLLGLAPIGASRTRAPAAGLASAGAFAGGDLARLTGQFENVPAGHRDVASGPRLAAR